MHINAGILIELGQQTAKFSTFRNFFHKRNTDGDQWIGRARDKIQYRNFGPKGVISRGATHALQQFCRNQLF